MSDIENIDTSFFERMYQIASELMVICIFPGAALSEWFAGDFCMVATLRGMFHWLRNNGKDYTQIADLLHEGSISHRRRSALSLPRGCTDVIVLSGEGSQRRRD